MLDVIKVLFSHFGGKGRIDTEGFHIRRLDEISAINRVPPGYTRVPL
jgi:hypothetical protein